MAENTDPRPVYIGEFAFLADNYHWDSSVMDTASRLESLIARNQFPIYPDCLSIIVCRSGNFSLISSGVELKAGHKDAIITLGGQPIEDCTISPDCRFFYFSGKSKYFSTLIDLDNANSILRHALELRHPFLFRLPAKVFNAVEKLFFSAKELLQISPEPFKSGLVAGYARILSTLIAARLQDQDEKVPASLSVNRSLLADFLDNVRQHCHKHRRIAFYSSLAHLSPKYFSKLIKALSGKSPGDIIEEYTMAEAKKLLASKKFSVKEVSNMMNFSSASSFCKYFKAAEGCAPGHYIVGK